MFPSMKLTPIHAKSCSVWNVATIEGWRLATWNTQPSEKHGTKQGSIFYPLQRTIVPSNAKRKTVERMAPYAKNH